MTPPTLLLVRYLVAAAAFGLALRLRSIPFSQPREVSRGAAAAAALLVATSFGYLSAAQLLPLSLAVLIVYLMAAWAVLFGHLLGLERLTPAKLAAALLAVAGVALTVGVDLSRLHTVGLLLALASSILFGLVTTAGKQASRLADPMLVNLYAALFGIPVAAGLGLLLGNHVLPAGAAVWMATLGSAFLYIVGFGLVLAGLQLTSPSRAGVTMTLEPIVTVLLSIFLLGEPATPVMLLGAVLVFLAVALIAVQQAGSSDAPGR
jgi:drug/metabolite transporter (DMT)-like permease